MKSEKRDLQIGGRIKYRSWNELRVAALKLSADGYGVAVIGFADMSDNVLTITALPEGGR